MPLAAAGEVAVLAALLASRYISAHTDIPTGGNEVVGGSCAWIFPAQSINRLMKVAAELPFSMIRRHGAASI